MNSIIARWLAKQSAGWVLDGFPRSLSQAEFLATALAGRNISLGAAILLDVPFATLLERIKTRRECPECRWSGPVSDLVEGVRCPQCGATACPRPDDDEANFRNRFHEYTTHTAPVAEWYETQGLLVHCDATAAPETVARRLMQALAERGIG